MQNPHPPSPAFVSFLLQLQRSLSLDLCPFPALIQGKHPQQHSPHPQGSQEKAAGKMLSTKLLQEDDIKSQVWEAPAQSLGHEASLWIYHPAQNQEDKHLEHLLCFGWAHQSCNKTSTSCMRFTCSTMKNLWRNRKQQQQF